MSDSSSWLKGTTEVLAECQVRMSTQNRRDNNRRVVDLPRTVNGSSDEEYSSSYYSEERSKEPSDPHPHTHSRASGKAEERSEYSEYSEDRGRRVDDRDSID